MAVRQLRKTLRRPTYIVFSFVQPVIFVQTAVFGALVTGLGLTEDIKAGWSTASDPCRSSGQPSS
jgi:ABC-2 type transport system permease protein/oleandomycin transport system permease protein